MRARNLISRKMTIFLTHMDMGRSQMCSSILYNDQQMHTIISQIITLLHVSTLSCHPQTACNQYLAKLHQHFKCSCW